MIYITRLLTVNRLETLRNEPSLLRNIGRNNYYFAISKGY